jgi:hypothetical protein
MAPSLGLPAFVESGIWECQDFRNFIAGGLRGQVRLLATVSSIAEALPDDVAGFLKQPQHRQIQVDQVVAPVWRVLCRPPAPSA